MAEVTAVGSVLSGLGWGIGLGTAYGTTVDLLRTGITWAKWKALRGWLGDPKIAETLQSILSAEKDEVTGLTTKGIVETIAQFIDKTLDFAIAVDAAVAQQLFVQMIQQSVAYAISNSHAGAVGTVCNVYSGSASIHPFEVERVAEYADLIDRGLKAFLSASAGLNIPALTLKLQHGANQRIAEVFRQLQTQIDRLIDEWNDQHLDQYRHYITMARNRFQDALEMYENIVTRTYTLIEQMAQEHLSRIAEQVDTLEGARAWYDGGFISEDELREIAIRVDLERRASQNNWEEMLEELTSLTEETTRDWRIYVMMLYEEYVNAKALYLTVISRSIRTVVSEIVRYVNELAEELTKTIEDVCAYRNVQRVTELKRADSLGVYELSPEIDVYRLPTRRWRDTLPYTVVMEYQLPSPKLWNYVEVGVYVGKPYVEVPSRPLVEVEAPVVVYHYQTPSSKMWTFIE